MRKHYDFSKMKQVKNPYPKLLKMKKAPTSQQLKDMDKFVKGKLERKP